MYVRESQNYDVQNWKRRSHTDIYTLTNMLALKILKEIMKNLAKKRGRKRENNPPST